MNELEIAVQSCGELMNRNYRDHRSCQKFIISESKPVATMVERFVQSLSNANDSGSFDTSLEVKSFPLRKRSRCLTELDRDDLVKFVKDFESRKQSASSNKSQHLAVPVQQDPYIELADTDSDFESTDQEYFDANDDLKSTQSDGISYGARTPENTHQPYQITEEYLQKRLSFKKPYNDEKNCKAARLLSFISSARKKMQHLKTASCNTSRNSSPLPQRRSKLFDRGYRHLHAAAQSDTEDDDGISTGSQLESRNISPDSSFELQPPIVPTFKITPPHYQRLNPAQNFARIMRSSFHARHATILRRSISNPDNFTMEDILKEGAKTKSEFIEAKTRIVRRGLGAAMIRNLDVICRSQKFLRNKHIENFN